MVAALIGGLVTESGGALSHAAITAREWGIPAVRRMPRSDAPIQGGAWIRVDPGAGRVIIQAPE
ncbi:MAG: PEP-utilizing enzyme [Actinomycetota bacterium]|nr:PEP-utilizing enzyme [Actinomycetota bacterium]